MAKKASVPPDAPPVVDGVTIHCVHSELLPIHACKPNPINPNKHSEYQIAKLAALIKYHGWRRPIVMSRRSGMIVSGHGRLVAGEALKMTTVPVDWQDYDSPEQELADMLADNVIDDLSEFDGQAVADILVELDAKDYALELTALDAEDIERYIVGPTETPDSGDDDENLLPVDQQMFAFGSLRTPVPTEVYLKFEKAYLRARDEDGCMLADFVKVIADEAAQGKIGQNKSPQAAGSG